MRALVVVAIIALLSVAAPALAESSAEISLTPDLSAWGAIEFTAPFATIYATTDSAVDAVELRASKIVVATTWVERSDGTVQSSGTTHTSFDNARMTLGPNSMIVVDFPTGVHASARSQDAGPASVPWTPRSAPAVAIGPIESATFTPFFDRGEDAFPAGWESPRGWPAPSTPPRIDQEALRTIFPERSTLIGDAYVHLGEGSFTVTDADGSSRFFKHASSTSKSGSRTIENATFVAVKADAASVTLTPRFSPVGAFALTAVFTPSPVIAVTGTAAATHATGRVVVDDEVEDLDAEDVLFRGAFTLKPGMRVDQSAWDSYSEAMDEWGRSMDRWQGFGPMPPMPTYPNSDSDSERAFVLDATGDFTLIRAENDYFPLLAGAAVAGSLASIGVVAYAWPHVKFGAARLVLPLFTRLDRAGVRDNKIRDSILRSIQDEPGVHAIEISRRASCGWGTVVYHLGVLEKMSYVTSVREGRHRRYFPRGETHHYLHAPLALMKNPATSKVFDAIRRNPGIKQAELSKLIALAPSTVNWHVGRLESARLVVKRAVGRRVEYHASALGDEISQTAQA